MKNMALLIASPILGGVAGYLYYRFVGCRGGGWAITANPVGSIVYGALLGLMTYFMFVGGHKG